MALYHTQYLPNKVVVGNLWDDSVWDISYVHERNLFIKEHYDELPLEEKGQYSYNYGTGDVYFNGCTNRVSLDHKGLRRKRVSTADSFANIYRAKEVPLRRETGEAETRVWSGTETDSLQTLY